MTRNPQRQTCRYPRPFGIVANTCALLIVTLTLGRTLQAALNLNELDPQSEVWITLTQDLLAGDFYRPIHSPLGYGGTRYLPLFNILHAGASRLTGELIRSAYLVTFLATLGCLTAVYALLRQLGASKTWSLWGVALCCTAWPFQIAVVATRGELVSTAFALWGFVALRFGTSKRAHAWYLVSSFLLALAVLAKVTNLAAAAAAATLLLQRDRREAAKFLVAFGLGLGLLGFAVQLASEGRAFQIFASSGLGGQRSVDFAKFPLRLAEAVTEPGALWSWVTFTAAAVIAWRPARYGPTTVLLAWTFAMTAAIFSAYGTGNNHLLDLECVCVIWLVDQGIQTRTRRRMVSGLFAVHGVLALVLLPLHADWGLLRVRPQRGPELLTTAAEIRATRAPILSTLPLPVLLAGHRPVVLDSWMFWANSEAYGLTSDLHARIRKGEFEFVVVGVEDDVDHWFGAGTMSLLSKRYVPRRQGGYYVILERAK